MKTADDSQPSKKSLADDADLGPEPDWLLDDDPEEAPVQEGPVPVPALPHPEPVAQMKPQPEPSVTAEMLDVVAPEPEASRVDSVVAMRADRPWLWGITPLVLLLITGLVAWFGSTQTLNGVATWDALRNQLPPLQPARWAMQSWWAVLPLLALFLIYGTMPAGRAVTRIKVTGPLLSLALVGASIWVFAQHWQWSLTGIISIGGATAAVLATYLLVALGPQIKNLRQRLLAVAPLSAVLGYCIMLTVLSWQSYSNQPFGDRGSSALFSLLLVMIAAIFAFFLRDGLFALVLAIWFAGVIHQQWGEDSVISLISAVSVMLTGALAVLGTILATESHRPSLTTTVKNPRVRTSFFRKKEDSAIT